VSIDGSGAGPRVPARFLGLSFEAEAIPALLAPGRVAELVRLLRSLGRGTLRFGGVSADARVAWSQDGTRPGWAALAIDPRDLAAIAALARASEWDVWLTVNLGHFDPAAAAQEAATARALLGRRLTGIEIGNEPDRYARTGLRPGNWGFSAYSRELDVYRRAIARAAPGVAIAAPDASSGTPVLPWLRAASTLRPSVLTDHYYPLSSCGSAPTVSELLGAGLREQESEMFALLLAIERQGGRPLLIDESNSISCEGEPGVSDTLASALWATDYIARAMSMGVRGLDFHDLLMRPGAYSPLVLEDGALRANPEWYALLLAHVLEGSRALPTAASSAALSVHAFRTTGGELQLVLVNLATGGSGAMLVRLHLRGPFAADSALRLEGPRLTATTGIELGGRTVSSSGAWAPAATPHLYRHGAIVELALPAGSAALATLKPL